MSQLSPSSGPDSQTAGLLSIYETYLCREPADDVSLLIHNGPDEYTASMRTLQRSADYFAERDQVRAVERLHWEMAKVHMQHEEWERAARVLTPLWQTLSWRKAGWKALIDEVDWALRDCACRIRNLETLIAVDWELLSNSLTPRQDWKYDLSRALEPFKPLDARPRAVIKAENVLSCVSATFAFGASDGNVGENLPSQVVISSQAHSNSTPLIITQIRVAFGGSLKSVSFQHEPNEAVVASTGDEPVRIYGLSLQKPSQDAPSIPSSPAVTRASHLANDLIGSADLTLSPGAIKAFTIDHIPRDAGEVEVESLTLCLSQDDFDLEVIFTEDEQMHRESFWIPSPVGPVKKMLKRERSNAVKILPKPPKLQIEVDNVESIYYTDEDISLNIRIINEEQEEATVTLEARVIGSMGISPPIRWASTGEADRMAAGTTDGPPDQMRDPTISRAIGVLASSSDQSHGILIGATAEASDFDVEVRARYHLLSDPETPISKYSSTNIRVQLAFEASYSSNPIIDTEPWPSYFNVGELEQDVESGAHAMRSVACGLSQRWCLTSRLYSLATVSLVIDRVEPRILEIHEAAICNIASTTTPEPDLASIASNDIHEREFILEAQKINLEDRRSTYLDLRLEVTWHREGSDNPSIKSYLTLPELVVPFGEPRVLATAQNGQLPPEIIHLDYVIENPSTYALSFNLTMDTSEDFAFSGAKNMTIELLPVSRHNVRYNIMPLVKGVWISPQFRAFDTHFRKALKVNATQGMRSDKKGLSIWVDADG